MERVVCEEKHMGSRAVALVCRDAETARERFGADGVTGSLYTRTGRPFFDDPAVTEEILGRLRAAVTEAGLWEELGTDWLLLDAELMPWSLKASGLLRSQYAAVGAASGAPSRPRWPLWRRQRPGAWTSGSCWAVSGSGPGPPPRSPRPTAATAGPPKAWTGCGSPRSSCSPSRAAAWPRCRTTSSSR
ncbi:hypothetical protein GCM10009535_09890 [Streptomyces thermocarboxydovorans]|uniref:Polynucleotide kinase-phosphatase ligase domain-containing protein n=1 Tax=Streptomyces thermocarboxydovorans TaxID=59298 RepID=A0ABN1HBS5_9ACTN